MSPPMGAWGRLAMTAALVHYPEPGTMGGNNGMWAKDRRAHRRDAGDRAWP